MTDFHVINPEVAGGFGENVDLDAGPHPPVVKHLHYEFDGWMGDDLVTSFPCYLASSRLKQALEASPELSGFSFRTAEISKSEQFEEVSPEAARALPEVWWLQVDGRPGIDDLGLTALADLIVSSRALAILQRLNLANADISVFEASE